ncbi:MAG: ribonuclease E inhibitor RraB [Pseudomonadota bacterium]|uniref:ribonuclease E inhibitor RraB n=1 Tax=Thalassovita sp. TaxID=1979401 RepID=UPI002AB21D0B|nr:ribonuclease E inhibitor RraB [Thalassovita sp.]MEC7963213.1 ribonuclease E inhibitor RraB [Pseudomonadota bacterium]MEC8041378.1 ribonuclease E inhibitor RraB [Pseudomonadota bacterium]MEC8295245.1 ribonuclease E inhibitor RraB [Pseudomonadota bacterium]
MAHDFDSQKAETFSAFSDLQAEGPLPTEADLDLFFVPVDADADWRPAAQALADLGFETQWITGAEDEPDTLIATMADHLISAAAIWTAEELATKAALENGFAPDGWGFAEN